MKLLHEKCNSVVAGFVFQYTINGKKVEVAVKQIIAGKEVEQRGAFSNPETLDLYQNIPELQNFWSHVFVVVGLGFFFCVCLCSVFVLYIPMLYVKKKLYLRPVVLLEEKEISCKVHSERLGWSLAPFYCFNMPYVQPGRRNLPVLIFVSMPNALFLV